MSLSDSDDLFLHFSFGTYKQRSVRVYTNQSNFLPTLARIKSHDDVRTEMYGNRYGSNWEDSDEPILKAKWLKLRNFHKEYATNFLFSPHINTSFSSGLRNDLNCTLNRLLNQVGFFCLATDV